MTRLTRFFMVWKIKWTKKWTGRGYRWMNSMYWWWVWTYWHLRVKGRSQPYIYTHLFALGTRLERSPALAYINKIEPCMTYANPETGSSRMAARWPKLCLSTFSPLAFCQLMAIFTYLICEFSINTGRIGCSLPSDWRIAVSKCLRGNRKQEPPLCPLLAGLLLALSGWFNCEVGWRWGSGPGVSGSTLFSHPGFQGPWRWRSACQIKSHSQVSLPAVMYIHWSSRCLALLEIYKKVNC